MMRPVDLSPETELLLCCARTVVGPAQAARLRALLGYGVHWAHVIRSAQRHHMLPLLYSNLNALHRDAVPEAALSELQDRFNTNAARNLFVTHELLKLLDLFDRHRIPAVPFKGPTLAALAYGDPFLRTFGDLDILVHKQDVFRAQDLLISRGHRPRFQEGLASKTGDLESAYADSFVSEDARIGVDLHWHITYRYHFVPVDTELMWERISPVSLIGDAVHTFSTEAMLLILCIQGTKDSWKSLKHICDVAELLRVPRQIDWSWLIEQCNRCGAKRIVAIGLLLANEVLEAPVPSGILQRLRADRAVQSVAMEVSRHLYNDIGSGTGYPPRGVAGHAFFLKSRERLRDKVRYSIFLARTNQRDRWHVGLPAVFSLLYYLLWPLWQVGKHALRPIRTIQFDNLLYRKKI